MDNLKSLTIINSLIILLTAFVYYISGSVWSFIILFFLQTPHYKSSDNDDDNDLIEITTDIDNLDEELQDLKEELNDLKEELEEELNDIKEEFHENINDILERIKELENSYEVTKPTKITLDKK